MANLRTPIARDLVRAEGQRYPYPHSTKGCSVVFIQLVIRPFWADFDLRGSPPVYKTAALPIELRRHQHRRLAQAILRKVRVDCGMASTDPLEAHFQSHPAVDSRTTPTIAIAIPAN